MRLLWIYYTVAVPPCDHKRAPKTHLKCCCCSLWWFSSQVEWITFYHWAKCSSGVVYWIGGKENFIDEEKSVIFSGYFSSFWHLFSTIHAMDKDVSNGLISVFFSDFVPIDLDEWWAQRFLENIDKLSWRSSGIRCSRTVWRWDRDDGSQKKRKPGREFWWVKVPRCGWNGLTVLITVDRETPENHLNLCGHTAVQTDCTQKDEVLKLRFILFSLSQQRCYFEMQ